MTVLHAFARRMLVATMLLSFLSSSGLMAQETPLRTITVSGEGKLDVEPDMAVVRFGIVTVAPDAETACRDNALAAGKAMEAARALIEDERKIKLESLRLAPARRYNPETRRHEEIGYEASREVSVRVLDLDRLPELIERVVADGANRLNGIQYDLQDRDSVRDSVLVRAMTQARHKAALMAKTLGVSVGAVVQIQEEGLQVPRPILMTREAGVAKADAAVPEAYAAGEMEVQASVRVVFEIGE